MSSLRKPHNLFTLRDVLPIAEKGGYALGSFSTRSTVMIEPVLRAGQAAQSPLIVQISQKELDRYKITPREYGEAFREQLEVLQTSVPVVLHLDHTWELPIIWDAIDAGFTSVMIDASKKALDENIATTKEVAEYAHARGVSVEAELGRIGTTDMVESDEDVEFYTNPVEAQRFVAETGVDALAVSVGTAHGVYLVRQPKIDYARLMAIRKLTPVALVIHGGSGIPAEMLHQSFRLPGGGVTKVNIATDLELASLAALGREQYLTNAELKALPASELEKARAAVQATVEEKIQHFVLSAHHAQDYAALLRE